MKPTRGLLIAVILGVALLMGTLAWADGDLLQKAEELNHEAERLSQQGRYAEAVPVMERVLAMREKFLGPEHPDTGAALNQLAMLYDAMGVYDKAIPLYRRALAICEKVLGPEHPITAISLNNLAVLYQTIGAYDNAEPLLQRSLAIREKVMGPEHPDTAIALNNLAELYRNMGAYDRAEPLFRRSIAITEKVLGPEHADNAFALNNLALLYETMGAYDRAELFFHRSLAINEKVLGPNHPDTAAILNNLSGLYAIQGKSDEALELMERAQKIDRMQIDQILVFVPEAQQTKFLITLGGNLYAYLSMIRQRFPENPKAVRSALDAWLARKGILLEVQKQIQDVLTGEDNKEAQEIFANLKRVRQELARLFLGGPGEEGSVVYQKRLAGLTSQKEALEGRLGRLSQAFAKQRKTRIATTSAVASALPAGAVLIEVARIWDYDFKAGKWGASRYLAFVLSSGKGSNVSLIDLGDADNIDQKVTAFRKSSGNSKTLSNVLAKQSNDLYKLIFAPLTSALGASRQIFLSPDG